MKGKSKLALAFSTKSIRDLNLDSDYSLAEYLRTLGQGPALRLQDADGPDVDHPETRVTPIEITDTIGRIGNKAAGLDKLTAKALKSCKHDDEVVNNLSVVISDILKKGSIP